MPGTWRNGSRGIWSAASRSASWSGGWSAACWAWSRFGHRVASPRSPTRRRGSSPIAATLLAYGTAELAHGYGFLAVFVAAVVLRGAERNHEFQGELHGFAEQMENLLVVGLLLLLGGALVSGVLDDLTVAGAVVAVLLVFVVRPLSGLAALTGSRMTRHERWAIAFFGIRGFGSIYYLAFASSETHFDEAGLLWAIVALTLVISIAVHGISATPVMHVVDRAARRRRPRRRPS